MPENFLRQILHASLAGCCLLIAVLSEITLCIWNWWNTKLWVQILQLHNVNCYRYVPNNYFHVFWKKTGSWAPQNWYISVLKCEDPQRRAKLVAVGQKRHEWLTHAWSYACCLSFAMHSTFSAVSTVFSLLLPVLRCIKNFADPVTVHAHEYIYISISLSSTFT